jgi:hypothetical protein
MNVVGIVVIASPSQDPIGSKRRASKRLMSTHASILLDNIGPPSVEVYRTAASFP